MNKSKTIKDLLAALAEDLSTGELLAADISSSLSNAIARHRLSMGLKQRELADKIGVSQSTVSKWENGDMNFTVDTLADIASKLGMELVIELRSPLKMPQKDGYRTISRSKVIDLYEYQTKRSFTEPKKYERMEM